MAGTLVCLFDHWIKGDSLSNMIRWSYISPFHNQNREVGSIINQGERDFTNSNLPANVCNPIQQIKIHSDYSNDKWEWVVSGGKFSIKSARELTRTTGNQIIWSNKV